MTIKGTNTGKEYSYIFKAEEGIIIHNSKHFHTIATNRAVEDDVISKEKKNKYLFWEKYCMVLMTDPVIEIND